MSSIVFIVNPNAASGSGKAQWEVLEQVIKDTFPHAEILHTESSHHATELARDALKRGVESIISCGGDGTLHEVVNGFYENGEAINSNATLGMIGLGTGRDFLRSLFISMDPKEQVDVIKQAKRKQVDAGVVSLADHHGQPTHRYFVNGASFGLGAEVINIINKSDKRWGRLAFLFPAMRVYRRFKPTRVLLTLDDRMTVEEYVMNVTICNGPFSGAGMRWNTKSKMDDGLFEIVILRRLPFIKALFNVLRLYTGSFEEMKEVTVYQAKTLKVTGDRDLWVECEGEEPGKLPATFKVLPNAINVFIP